ncbi:MepB family protein [Tamlana sp. 62-3]|uniref:MepB family protein n=1 Tax=Neotamlana sargassicola TaxID=2883125 RepID=A0A9X1L5Y0_9FLAO|nr:MepB family protein [Tamlana sargassicola]MCB4807034.1 MepB family protein [Tamlana sargassicola]
MDKNLKQIKTQIYDACALNISNFKIEKEGKAYQACRFELNGLKVLSRTAKITPNKVGQFVTFWKRNKSGIIEPFNVNDNIDFYIVNVSANSSFGQFVFPKSVLINKGIISTKNREGKRGFRVYPTWDIPKSKQAERTQKWQSNYFFEINNTTNFKQVTELYQAK